MDEFKAGDVVQLKSGGPKMTVREPQPQKTIVECQWFGGSKLESGWFPKVSLIKVKEDENKDRKS